MMRRGSLTNWLCPPNRAYLIKLIVTSGEIQLPCELTKLAKEEDQLTHGYIDVVRVVARIYRSHINTTYLMVKMIFKSHTFQIRPPMLLRIFISTANEGQNLHQLLLNLTLLFDPLDF